MQKPPPPKNLGQDIKKFFDRKAEVLHGKATQGDQCCARPRSQRVALTPNAIPHTLTTSVMLAGQQEQSCSPCLAFCCAIEHRCQRWVGKRSLNAHESTTLVKGTGKDASSPHCAGLASGRSGRPSSSKQHPARSAPISRLPDNVGIQPQRCTVISNMPRLLRFRVTSRYYRLHRACSHRLHAHPFITRLPRSMLRSSCTQLS